MEEFSAEGLYFDHNMMETFIFTILMPLHIEQKHASDDMLREAYLAV